MSDLQGGMEKMGLQAGGTSGSGSPYYVVWYAGSMAEWNDGRMRGGPKNFKTASAAREYLNGLPGAIVWRIEKVTIVEESK